MRLASKPFSSGLVTRRVTATFRDRIANREVHSRATQTRGTMDAELPAGVGSQGREVARQAAKKNFLTLSSFASSRLCARFSNASCTIDLTSAIRLIATEIWRVTDADVPAGDGSWVMGCGAQRRKVAKKILLRPSFFACEVRIASSEVGRELPSIDFACQTIAELDAAPSTLTTTPLNAGVLLSGSARRATRTLASG